eukprot:GFUD01040660.1.p1 GENE.GFUD01040660.1~~GFUD01040660.1.p1  ORF type:complete len:251 (+),score=38.78 GFUD01040660.1:189-941(+)
MASVKIISLILVLTSMILPIQNQLFVNTDKPDVEVMYNYFANPVIQWRTFIGIVVQWVARFTTWVLLGAVWAQIRGDQYDYNLNTTVLFNYVVSDTKATQNTIKAVGFGALAIIIFQKLASKGSPIPVPQKVDIVRGRREAGWKDGWEMKEDKILRTSNIYSDQTSQNLKYSKESDPEASSSQQGQNTQSQSLSNLPRDFDRRLEPEPGAEWNREDLLLKHGHGNSPVYILVSLHVATAVLTLFEIRVKF